MCCEVAAATNTWAAAELHDGGQTCSTIVCALLFVLKLTALGTGLSFKPFDGCPLHCCCCCCCCSSEHVDAGSVPHHRAVWRRHPDRWTGHSHTGADRPALKVSERVSMCVAVLVCLHPFSLTHSFGSTTRLTLTHLLTRSPHSLTHSHAAGNAPWPLLETVHLSFNHSLSHSHSLSLTG